MICPLTLSFNPSPYPGDLAGRVAWTESGWGVQVPLIGQASW